jgi:hypothetical protein
MPISRRETPRSSSSIAPLRIRHPGEHLPPLERVKKRCLLERQRHHVDAAVVNNVDAPDPGPASRGVLSHQWNGGRQVEQQPPAKHRSFR